MIESENKGLFFVGLKLVGALTTVTGIGGFLNSISSLLNTLTTFRGTGLHTSVNTPYFLLLAPVVQIVIGIYLLRDGQLVWNIAYGNKSTTDSDAIE